MNILLIDKNDYTDGPGTVRVYGRRFIHVKEILSPAVGDSLKCGELGGLMGLAHVTAMNDEYLEMKVSLTEAPPAKIPVNVILALPRPRVFRRILQNATSMGVRKIFIINANRVEKSYWQSPALHDSVIKEQLILGLEQANDTIPPTVTLCKSFDIFMKNDLPDIIKGTKPILAHPGAGDHLCPSAGETVTLAVGPEGGFIQHEVEEFCKFGFGLVGLGKRILKTETALTALIARSFPNA
ncbi:MAG: 16S rRNA (uracil(1498)-N(3))-methyltransferase [Candidatus Omnitrophica bacterium]|nr:16S rRNA (uracil(1498)-N(3))-methyltransferase [Candidatus Omnitrophota bacterium]